MARLGQHVWLLREPEAGDDPYEDALRAAGFGVSSHPVLRFVEANDSVLEEALRHPDRYSGIIVTSPRAASRLSTRLPSETEDQWRDKPSYCVGYRSGRPLDDAGFPVRGQASGTGELLARHIIANHDDARPLLFLAGNRRRPDLPDALKASGVSFLELTVYETHTVRLEEPDQLPDWLAFFSPSGVPAIAEWSHPEVCRIAAIGMTTADALASAGISIDAIAEEPTASSLVHAMIQAV